MFTGMVESMGIVSGIQRHDKSLGLNVRAPEIVKHVKKGSSLSVSGVCLTVAEKKADGLMFDVMAETLRKTTLGKKKAGDKVNLETSLTLQKEIGGHLVYAHVDGVGKVVKVKKVAESLMVTIQPPRKLMKYLAPQGSVVVDGVSLTVAQVTKQAFVVSLVDYTIEHTTLGSLRFGDIVNIEYDMIAKYVEMWLGIRSRSRKRK